MLKLNVYKKVVFGFFILFLTSPIFGKSELPIYEGIGDSFKLESSLNKKLGLKDFRGKVMLVFFGYTNCPDICPLTTSHMNSVMRKLGNKAKKVQVLFITVDPETDTPEVLKKYLSYFNQDFIGLTGTRKEVDKVLELFIADYTKVHSGKLPLDIKVTMRTGQKKGYIYSHSAKIYLIDQKGRTRNFYYVGTPVEQITTEILTLLE